MNYQNVLSVHDALSLLESHNGKARIIGGGTDLVIDVNEGKVSPDLLIDITKIPSLNEIKIQDNKLLIGSAVTLTTIARSELVKKHAPSLAKAAGTVGSLQIRNIATLAGNVINAQPAADGAMMLSALGATFIIENKDGAREVDMPHMYAGFGKSTLDSSLELLTTIIVPCQGENEASEFMRLELRKSLALPMLNAGVMAKIVDNQVVWARISMGPVGVGPKRATTAENWFAGKAFTLENIKEASRLALEDAAPRSNPLRGSKEYRTQTLPVLIERGFLSIANQLNIELI